MHSTETETLTLTIPRTLMETVRQQSSPEQFIVEAIEYYLQHRLKKPSDTWAFDLCGQWQDDRTPEEIAEQIIGARTAGRDSVL